MTKIKVDIEANTSGMEREFSRIEEILDRMGRKVDTSKMTAGERTQYVKQEAQFGREEIQKRRGAVDEYLSDRSAVAQKATSKDDFDRKITSLTDTYKDKHGFDPSKKGISTQLDTDEKDLTEATRDASKEAKRYNLEEKIRHAELKSMSSKELEALAKNAEAATEATKVNGTEGEYRDAVKNEQTIKSALKSSGGGDGDGDESRVMKYIKATLMREGMGSAAKAFGGETTQGMSNVVGAGMQGAAAGGPIGAGIAMLLGAFSMVADHAKEIERASDSRNQITGLSGEDSLVSGARGFGMKKYEAIAESRSVASQRGRGDMGGDLAGATLEQMRLKKAFGLDDGALGQLNQNAMFGGGQSNTETIARSLKVLERAGQANLSSSNFDIASLPKFLQQLSTMNQIQMERLGRVNNAGAVSGLGGIMGMGGMFANSQTAMKLSQGIDASFNSPGSSIEEYYSNQAILKTHPELRRKDGSIDYTGVEKAKENVMSDPALLKQAIGETINRGKNMGADDSQFAVNSLLADKYKLSITQADELQKQYSKSGGFQNMTGEDVLQTLQKLQVDSRAKTNTLSNDVVDAAAAGYLLDPGSKVWQNLKTVIMDAFSL